jgi:penicillin amidase
MSREDPSPRDPDLISHPRPRISRTQRIVGLIFPVLVLLGVVGYFGARRFIHKAIAEALPQLDGSLTLAGLSAPVTVTRDARGVPYIHAATVDDLLVAQGYITAQDRLWQMDMLRRHAAGELAAILGSSMLEHDRLQRTLQIRASADRAIAALPADQKHWFDCYARGVNGSILVELAMFQDLTTGFPAKLGREALAARLPPELIADLYPVGSWRDHTPGDPIPDLTTPQPEFEDIPLDESQSSNRVPASNPGGTTTEPGAQFMAPSAMSGHWHEAQTAPANAQPTTPPQALLSLQRALALFHPPCRDCVAGSNDWAVAGSRTASGKPLLSNDMHLTLNVPGLWYEADLSADSAPPFHVAGVTLPGTPLVVVGHNDHIAWGFTNLGADVQDIYIEHTRGTPTGAEYQSADGAWHTMLYHSERIHVRGAADVVVNVPLTQHGTAETPVLSTILPGEQRTLSLRWTIYDTANVTAPFFEVNSAHDWASMLAAISAWGGPAQNMVYADDQNHIGYHAVGRIPLRGDPANPSPLSPIPTDATASDAASHEWAGYIPFDQLPQSLDPTDGVLATANARVTPNGYKYPITLNWSAAYRTERIYKVLEARHQLTPADMLALQTDVSSVFDQVIAQRLAYSIDHTTGPLKSSDMLHQAADILRNWNGSVDASAAAPAIVNAARAAFWPMLLNPKLNPQSSATGSSRPPTDNSPTWQSYIWGESASVEEQLVTHTPARWLPPTFATWEDFLAAVVDRGLRDAHAPRDLTHWSQGQAFPLDLEHPIFARSALLRSLIGVPVGTGPQPNSGDSNTVKQIKGLLAPSERFTADFGDLNRSTLNLPLGQSGNISSPWYFDQFQSWLHGTTYLFPTSPAPTTHTLTLTPQ